MDLGVPGSFLGLNSGVFVCISAVLAISCKTNTINVRGSTGRHSFCSVLEGSNSGGGFLGFSDVFCHHWAFPMVFVVVVVVVVLVVFVEFERWSGPVDGFGCTFRLKCVQIE